MGLITYTIKDHVATITFNTPENLNALDEAMGAVFGRLLDELSGNQDIRVAILTGAGRAFSSGGNLAMIEARTRKAEKTNKDELKKFYRIYLKLRDLPFPVIAAINGPAVGAGFCLALACDMRYAAKEAKMGANFARIGLAPGMGGTYFTTRLVGVTRAAEILLTAEIFSAEKADKMGLLNGVCNADDLMPHVQSVAAKIAVNAPHAVRMIKKGIQKALHATLEEIFDYDSACQAKSFLTEDIREGIQAVREKREPLFSGK